MLLLVEFHGLQCLGGWVTEVLETMPAGATPPPPTQNKQGTASMSDHPPPHPRVGRAAAALFGVSLPHQGGADTFLQSTI